MRLPLTIKLWLALDLPARFIEPREASAEQFEHQGPACPRAWRRFLPAISCTLPFIRSLSHFENAG